MMQVGVMAASRLAGVNRATVWRYCTKGKLSFTLDADGARLIDTAELERVFGTLQPAAMVQQPTQRPPQQPPATVAGAPVETTLVAELRRQLERLESDLDRARVALDQEQRERRALADKLQEAQERLLRLLAPPVAPEQGNGARRAPVASGGLLDAFRRLVDGASA